MLSLVAGVEGLADVLVWVGLESSWSSIIVSRLVVSSVVFTTSSEYGGSVCLRFEFGWFSLRLESVEVNFNSVSWCVFGWVFNRVGGDVYCRRLDCWLSSCCWLLGVGIYGVTLYSSRVTLIILIMLRFMMLICCAIMYSHFLSNVVWKSFRLSLKFSLIVDVILILFSVIIVFIVDLLSFVRPSSSSFHDEEVNW